MKENNIEKYRELEERTTKFAKNVIRLCKSLPKDQINFVLVNQAVRSAGSIGANYREANDALSKKDCICRMRIARKEAKETSHWLDLIREANLNRSSEIDVLFNELIELRNILSTIINKLTNKVP